MQAAKAVGARTSLATGSHSLRHHSLPTARPAHQPSYKPRPRSTTWQHRRCVGAGGRAALLVRSHSAAPAGAEVNVQLVPDLKPEISHELFDQLDIRVGKVLSARPINVEVLVTRGERSMKRNKKILEIKVDIGSEVRTIVADIIQTLDEETAVGKSLMIAANVPPREVHGVVSHGRVIMGHNYDDTPMPRSFKEILPKPGALPKGACFTGM